MTENIIILNFAEAKQPIFKEKKGEKGGYIQFGEDNLYPNYLLGLYNQSAKNNAIIKGKVNYITGNGWATKEIDPIADQFIKQPNQYESLNDLTRKVSVDIEIFGGAYLEVIWSAVGGQLASINHIDYTKIRSSKDNTQFWYKKDWSDRKEEMTVLAAFSTQIRSGKQILYIKEYRPGLETYALPGYMGSLNYIESDVEVSRHVLGNAQTGFSASKMITLPNGEPSQDEKRVITKQFENRFTGSDGKKFILSFVSDPTRKPIIEDLGSSDITKEDFSRVDAIIQQNLFAGHQIVSPMLFGIKTEGQLGGASEIRNAYEIFKSTYVNDKQQFLETIFNMLGRLKGAKNDMYIMPVEPIGFEFTETTLVANMTKDEIREKLGLPKIDVEATSAAQQIIDGINSLSPLVANKVLESMTEEEIRSLVGLQSKNMNPETGQPVQEAMINENIKNLTGRQHQQLLRILRQFNQGKITKQIATTMLKTGLGLNDQDINSMLGIDDDPLTDDATFAAVAPVDTEETLSIWEEYGESRDNFTVLQQMEVNFDINDPEILKFEEDAPVTTLREKQLLEIIKKDPLIPPDDIARVLRMPKEEVLAILNDLQTKKIITFDPKTASRKIIEPMDKIVDAPPATVIVVRYSYEWKPQFGVSDKNKTSTPLITKSRPFCRKLLTLGRMYSRREIQSLTARLGYNVFTRGGGWWGVSPSCRHRWVANRVIQKSKNK